MTISFAPNLYVTNVADAIDFYIKALNAVEILHYSNDDGSVHVAEMTIGDAIFHMHEETPRNNRLSPETLNGTTVEVGLFIEDVDNIFQQAVSAGAEVLNSPQDYEYGYRQATIKDPFGHQWTFQKKINI